MFQVGITYVEHVHATSPVWLFPVLLFGYLFITLYLYAPLKVRRSQTARVNVEFYPLPFQNLPASVVPVFNLASEQLVACGFHVLGLVTRDLTTMRQSSFVSVWIDPATGDTAQIIGILTPSQLKGVIVKTLLAFRTEFTDETAIVTSNSPTPSCFPPDPLVSSLRCTEIQDIAALHHFHRARIERDAIGKTPTLERTRDAVERMKWEHDQTYGRLVRAGYFAMDSAGQMYVPTLKGAYLMTWKLLPPFKQIQLMRKDMAARSAMRRLGCL